MLVTFEPRPVLGFGEFHRQPLPGIPDSSLVTLYVAAGSGFVPIHKIPGTEKPFGLAMPHDKGLSGKPEILWDLPVRPTEEIRRVISGYVEANGFAGPPEQYQRLMQMMA